MILNVVVRTGMLSNESIYKFDSFYIILCLGLKSPIVNNYLACERICSRVISMFAVLPYPLMARSIPGEEETMVGLVMARPMIAQYLRWWQHYRIITLLK